MKQKSDVRTLNMELDHRTVAVPAGVSVLRAAELNGISIPSLCSHKDLTPFGGCRMCVVEIEGMRGYPLSCSTIVQEGMKVLTNTSTLRDMRKEILQLILSEHPSSCLICEESRACRQYQLTIRKSGVSTGCRSCPNNDQCELQDVVDKIGLTEINYPIFYHGYEPEHDDPFFDRDYNICILCGRCVRMCQEVRGTSVLTFTHRGPRIKIGTAFGDSHVAAGCEFCGACVSVCPTGALVDKSSKWDGVPDGAEVSTCPFCSLGCQVDLHHKKGRLSKVYPNPDEEINDGQLCLRGRFCLPEATHHHKRAKKPMLQHGKYFREVTWPEALEEVSTHLKDLKEEDFLMVVSGDLTNESLYTAEKFVRSCLGTGNIDSTGRQYLSGGPQLWNRLFSLPISIKGIAEADTIIAMGLDSRFYFSVAGVQVRHALKKGAQLVTIDARDTNLARYTDHHLQPTPGREGLLLRCLAECLAGQKSNVKTAAKEAGVATEKLKKAIEWLKDGDQLAIIIGPALFQYSDTVDLLHALFELAKRPHTTFLPLYHGSNVRGALELGVFGERLPGAAKTKGTEVLLSDVTSGRKHPKVIYLVGEAPFLKRPECDFLICQDTYLPPFPVDAFLPAASFAEAGGTLTNIEGRVQEIVQIENPPDGAVTGFVRPDWRIFAELSQKLGCQALQYENVADILLEIHQTIPNFPATADRKPRRMTAGNEPILDRNNWEPAGKGDFLLMVEYGGFQHRNNDLATVVEGLGELVLEQGLRINPDDLSRLGAEAGGSLLVTLDGRTLELQAKEDPDCPTGTVYAYRPLNFGGLHAWQGEQFFADLPSNPVRVSLTILHTHLEERHV
ncbi:MAG: molybdopterin-dependent oxidoreductase [Pseudomonadota bacterium]